MTWTPTEKEIEVMLNLDGQKRYVYCVKKSADQLCLPKTKSGKLGKLGRKGFV